MISLFRTSNFLRLLSFGLLACLLEPHCLLITLFFFLRAIRVTLFCPLCFVRQHIVFPIIRRRRSCPTASMNTACKCFSSSPISTSVLDVRQMFLVQTCFSKQKRQFQVFRSSMITTFVKSLSLRIGSDMKSFLFYVRNPHPFERLSAVIDCKERRRNCGQNHHTES